MQKRSAIRWRSSDEKELAKTVRKFNAKRTRLIKKIPELAEYLPEKASVKDIRENVETRRELKNKLNSLERFMRKEAETPILTPEGIKTTKYEKKEVGIKVRAINKRKTAERKKANVSTEKGTMGTIKANNLNPKKYNLFKIRKSDWDKFISSVEKQFRDSYWTGKSERYKQNYLSAIEDYLGIEGKELYDFVSKLDPDFIYDNYYDDPILSIQFISDPLDVETITENAMNHWLMAMGEEVITDYI